MTWLIIGLLVLVAGLIVTFTVLGPEQRGFGIIGSLVIGVLIMPWGMFYTQDVGEAKVLKTATGTVLGSDTSAGLSFKAPWVKTVNYDIRNQQVTFRGDGSDKNDNGAQITIQDKEGVSADIDINVRYSIDPTAVEQIHSRYQSQQNFVSRFIENDIRAGVRSVPSQYTTLGLLGGRVKVETDLRAYLEKRWEKSGVLVESVSLQDIRYPDAVKQRFSDAQTARTNVEVARAKLEETKVSAEAQVVEAEAASKANNLLNKSLTPEVLQYKQLQTLEKVGEKGNTIIVPQGTSPFIQVPAAK